MRTLRSLLSMLLVMYVAAPGPASAQQQAQGTIDVAVFPLNGFMLGGSAEERRGLLDAFRAMVITEMSTGQLRILERSTVDEMLEQQRISLSGAVSDEQAIRIGRLLGVQYAAYGQISLVNRRARLDLRFTDVETGESIHVFKQEDVPEERLLSMVSDIASQFVGKAQLKPRQQDVAVPVAAALAYSRGLDFEKRGRRQEAAVMYRRALEIFPGHPLARAALERVT